MVASGATRRIEGLRGRARMRKVAKPGPMRQLAGAGCQAKSRFQCAAAGSRLETPAFMFNCAGGRRTTAHSMTSIQLPSFDTYALLPNLLNATRRGIPPSRSVLITERVARSMMVRLPVIADATYN